MPYLPARLEPEHPEGRGDDHPLLLVVGRRDALERLKPLECLLSALGFVRNHTPHRPPEDLGRRTEMKGTPERLHIAPESQELQILQLVPVEVAAHVDALTAHNDHFVAVQNELGDDGAQPTHEVAAAIDDHRLKEEEGSSTLKFNK